MNRTFTLKRVLAFTLAVITSITVLASGKPYISTSEVVRAESAESKKNSANISNTQDKIDDLKKKQQELDKQIAETEDSIDDEEANQKAIEEQITTVQETIVTLEESIAELNAEISDLELSIAESEKNIAQKKSEIENGVYEFKQRLRAMYIAGNSSYSDILIGATDFYDMLMKIELVKRVAEHDDGMIDELVVLKEQYEAEEAQLTAKKEQLEASRTDLQAQQAEHESQKDKLEDLYAKSQAVIDELNQYKEDYQANAEQLKKEQEEFEDELQQLYEEREAIKKKEEEEAARKKAEEEAKKKAEEEAKKQAANSSSSSGSSSSSSSSGSSSSSSGSTNNSDYGYTQKSQFTWPVPGFYHISYGVGWRWGAYHKGIDIWSPGIRGAKICASAAGTVIRVYNGCTHDYGKNGSCGCGGGYGNYCIIDHGNGYWTLYGHSQYISVSVGDYVEQGDVLGIIGSTGYSTGDHLHFEIRLNGVALNPSDYV